MRRSLIVVFIAAALLAACGGGGSSGAALLPSPTPPGVPAGGTASVASACTKVYLEPTPDPTMESLFPAVGSSDHVLGEASAPTTIIVYSDFQCPGCAGVAAALNKIVDDSAGKVRLVFRPFPLSTVNDKALLAAQAAEAAGEQGKFWEMHDLLFSSQPQWKGLAPDAFQTWLVEKAVPQLGLDKDKFSAALNREDIVARVKADMDFGVNTGLAGAPFMLINGQIYGGPKDYDTLSRITSLLGLGDRQFKTCPPTVIDPNKQYFATLHTDKGDIVIQLLADKAPRTVNNFVFLAQQGWFDNITFHRVIPGFVAQTGDPSGTGLGNPGYYINNEIDPTLKYDREGVVGMANSGPDTNGSQFFITYGPAPHLDGSYTIFGQVIQGMDVAKTLTERDPQPGQTLPPGDKLISVTIEEK